MTAHQFIMLFSFVLSSITGIDCTKIHSCFLPPPLGVFTARICFSASYIARSIRCHHARLRFILQGQAFSALLPGTSIASSLTSPYLQSHTMTHTWYCSRSSINHIASLLIILLTKRSFRAKPNKKQHNLCKYKNNFVV